jgi:hypothetical protein
MSELDPHLLRHRMEQREPALGISRVSTFILEDMDRGFLLAYAILHHPNVFDRGSISRFRDTPPRQQLFRMLTKTE